MTEVSSSAGISDISLYVPSPSIGMDTLVKRRVLLTPRLDRHLERACRVTGQKAIRFPEIWEDSATLAATAARGLLTQNPGLDGRTVRHLAVGTETGVDHSKPVSAYVQGMLQRAGYDLGTALSSFQVQHACAGGTMALLSVASLLMATGRPSDCGMVVSTDVARYETDSTAEITQGAGAVALLVQSAPRLLELDLATAGFASTDVDDFFRPLGSITARVNGTYSMRCYEESLQAAFLDHCARSGTRPEEALRDCDYFALHTPFPNMPAVAMEKLMEKVLGYDGARARAVLEEKSFWAGVEPLSRIGNLYTGSLTAALAFLLEDRFRALGSGIVGKTILLASYGSGSTMVVIKARVAASAPEVIARWRLADVFASARPATFEEYEAWTAGPVQPELHARLMENAAVPSETFHLSGIRKDGYREYDFSTAPRVSDRGEEREAPDDLHGSVALPG
ncbi:MAG TPA: hydroxymethylglutaryl-CoA synthase [Spirochaetia bacterium]|nr:hydroxymethylglutaryl-CoA synthase [Spirochaetia bacterium]